MSLPAYIDAPLSAAQKREVALVSVHEPRFAKAVLRLNKGLFNDTVRRDLLKASKLYVAGLKTLEDVVEAVPWPDQGDPIGTKLWEILRANVEKAYQSIVDGAIQDEFEHQGWPKRIEKIDTTVPVDPYSIDFVRNKSVKLVVELSNEKKRMLRKLLADGVRDQRGNILIPGFSTGGRPEDLLDLIYELVGLTEEETLRVGRRRALLAEKGTKPEALERAVMRYTRKLGIARANRIARTETIEAYSQGLENSWNVAVDSGVIEPTAEKEWGEIASSKRTCEICLGLHAQKVPLNQPFYSDIVGAIERPPAHPHCRCTMFLVTD